MKTLKPSHREKKRYLYIKGKNLSKEIIEESIFNFIGVLGFAQAFPHVIKMNNDKIILSINRNSLSKIRASFLISEKDINIINVSASLKKIKYLFR